LLSWMHTLTRMETEVQPFLIKCPSFVITRAIRRSFRLFFKNCMAVHAKEARGDGNRKQAKMARPLLATPPGVAALAAAAGAAAHRISGWPLRLHTVHSAH
jgi:hypothetical protein